MAVVDADRLVAAAPTITLAAAAAAAAAPHVELLLQEVGLSPLAADALNAGPRAVRAPVVGTNVDAA